MSSRAGWPTAVEPGTRPGRGIGFGGVDPRRLATAEPNSTTAVPSISGTRRDAFFLTSLPTPYHSLIVAL